MLNWRTAAGSNEEVTAYVISWRLGRKGKFDQELTVSSLSSLQGKKRLAASAIPSSMMRRIVDNISTRRTLRKIHRGSIRRHLVSGRFPWM